MSPTQAVLFDVKVAHELSRSLAKRLGKAFGLDPDDILGRRRHAPLVAARHELFAEMWRAGYGVAEVARALCVDHTTVIHGLKRVMGEGEYKAEIAKRYIGPGYQRREVG